MARLSIGSYIIDTTAASSTTTSARLLLDPEDPFRPEVENQEQRWPIMYVAVESASESALKTAVDAVVSAIDNCNGKAITYQETASTDLYVMHPNVWTEIKGSAAPEMTGLTAIIAIAFIGSRPAPNTGGGTGNQAGQVGEIVWQYQIISGGLAGMVADGIFGPTLSGTTVTTTALANALVWLAALKTGSAFPSFASTSLKVVDVTTELIQQPNTTTGFTSVRLTVQFREGNVGGQTWPSLVQDGNYGASAVEGSPLDARSGQTGPSINIVLSGTFTVKVEGNTTFDAGDTKVAPGEVYAKALSAASSAIAHFETVYSQTGVIRVGDPMISIDHVTGVSGFHVVYETKTILDWQEKWVVKNEEASADSRDASGRDWLYEPNGGPITTLTHTFFARSISTPVGYRRPQLGSNWRRKDAEVPTVETGRTSNGTLYHETAGSSMWRYYNSQPRGPSSQQTIPANVVLTDQAVMSGRGDI